MVSLLASILLLGSVTSVVRDAMDFKFTVCGVPYQFKDRKIDWSFNPTCNNYAYDTSEMRKYVLSTRAHNTIRIDGKDQNTRRSWRRRCGRRTESLST